jgi:hypothetical protein
MADDELETVMNARAALARKRLTWAKTIAQPGEIAAGAIDGLIEVQQAIDVIDRAIEELEEAAELEELEEEDEK